MQWNYWSPHGQAQRATECPQRKLQLHTDAAPSGFTPIHKKHRAIMRNLPAKKRAIRWVNVFYALGQTSNKISTYLDDIFIGWMTLHRCGHIWYFAILTHCKDDDRKWHRLTCQDGRVDNCVALQILSFNQNILLRNVFDYWSQMGSLFMRGTLKWKSLE